MEGTAPATEEFFRIIRHPLKFRLFLLKNLPAALFSGVRIMRADENATSVSIPYKWLTRNPFRSTYFASLSMAAEMSTGILAMAQVYQRRPSIALLVVSIEGKFYKKAKGKTVFICDEGSAFREAIEQALAGQPETIRALSRGYNDQQELVAEFWVTWSFKIRGSV